MSRSLDDELTALPGSQPPCRTVPSLSVTLDLPPDSGALEAIIPRYLEHFYEYPTASSFHR